ncbi:MAG: hypothetical protein H0X24_08135 [Ktedonobacterales bacterium]|nr:hypothetical protein [Ktedonobacterales bacterium]
MNDTKVFYSAKEAQHRLGINANRFNYLVRTGRIKRVVPPGQKLGVYPVVDVDKLATLVNTTLELYDPTVVQVEIATTEDIIDVVSIGATVFHGSTSSVARVANWQRKCPEAIHVLKTGDDEVVGYAILLAMPEERILEILGRKISIDDVTIDDIYDFTPGQPLCIYVREIAVLPSSNKGVESFWGGTLITGIANFLASLGNRKVNIERLYALASTKHGRRASQVMGFDRMSIIPDPNRPNLVAFMLDMQKSTVTFVKQYRENYQKSLADSEPRTTIRMLDEAELQLLESRKGKKKESKKQL